MTYQNTFELVFPVFLWELKLSKWKYNVISVRWHTYSWLKNFFSFLLTLLLANRVTKSSSKSRDPQIWYTFKLRYQKFLYTLLTLICYQILLTQRKITALKWSKCLTYHFHLLRSFYRDQYCSAFDIDSFHNEHYLWCLPDQAYSILRVVASKR